MNPSGVRIGTPAVTTRGMKEREMKLIVGYIDSAFMSHDSEEKLLEIKQAVKELCEKFPVPTK
jgi:glycine hydroxymethyltransferase